MATVAFVTMRHRNGRRHWQRIPLEEADCDCQKLPENGFVILETTTPLSDS